MAIDCLKYNNASIRSYDNQLKSQTNCPGQTFVYYNVQVWFSNNAPRRRSSQVKRPNAINFLWKGGRRIFAVTLAEGLCVKTGYHLPWTEHPLVCWQPIIFSQDLSTWWHA